MALWKARSFTPEQKLQIAAEESGDRNLNHEDSGQFLGLEDAKKTEIFSSILQFDVSIFFPPFFVLLLKFSLFILVRIRVCIFPGRII